MFKRLSLLQKFSLICLLMLVLLGIMLNLSINYIMEKNLIRYAQEMTAAVIADEVAHELSASDLLGRTREDYPQLTRKVRHLNLGPNIERIKIWAADRTILWADDPDLVGLQFEDNHDLAEALNGEVEVELTWKQQKTEHLLDDENRDKRMLELYVPIRFAGHADVDVVFEVYRNLEPLYVEFDQQQQNVWCMLFGSFGLLFLALFTLVFRATRKIEHQRRGILESEAKYRNLIGSAQDGIISVNERGEIVLCNSAAQRMFGYRAEELTETPLSQLVPEEDRPQVARTLNGLLESAGGTGEILSWQGLHRSGRVFPLALTFAVSGENGSRLITAILRDETERQVMQKKALEAETLAGISVIASSIGHEINNAISGLFGYGQILQGRSGEDSFLSKCANTMVQQGEQLRLHANNLLSIGKPQPPRFGPLQLNDVIRQTTELLETSGMLKHLSVTREYSGDLPQIAGDPHLLEQLIRNLQINAIHAMGRKGTLTLRSGQVSDGRVFLEVEDTGSGIAEDQLEKVFEPFFTTKEEGRGTGLGLYIVRQIVEQHGGELQVDSRLDIGTRFRILFPVSFDKLTDLAV